MQETLHNPEKPEKPGKRSLVTPMIAIVVGLAIVLSLWFLLQTPQFRNLPPQPTTVTLKAGSSEQEYAKHIRVENIALSRAENFLHQEVTILNADVVNGGPLPLASLALTIEFYDDMNQVVLRESRSVLGKPPVTLTPGEKRSFEVSFDHVPTSWNMQQPAVRVSGLQLSSGK
jgi:hypothetical protein